MNPRDYYLSIIKNSNNSIQHLRRLSMAVAMLRLLVFIATVAACFIPGSALLIAVIAVCGLVIFLWLAKTSSNIDNRKAIEEAKINSSRLNIDRLDLKFDNLPEGNEHIDPSHDFAFDIDLFGKKSIFSLLASTSTTTGSRKLAEWLMHTEKVYNSVETRQEAVKELASNHSFRLEMASIGKVTSEEVNDGKHLNQTNVPDFSVGILWKMAYHTVPVLYAVMFILMAFDILPGLFIFYFFLLMLAISGLQAKRIGKLHEWLAVNVKRIACCSNLFCTIETGQFSSPVLQDLQAKVKSDTTCASLQTYRLMRIINNLDQRYNVFGYAIMNGFLLWDIRQIDNARKWMTDNAAKTDDWDECIAGFDAFCALATFRFNNPRYTFPIPDKSGETIIKAEEAGHPLIAADKCVCNDIQRLSLQSFFVVTGANMAGKSTYLRTVAVNYLLALIGAPVFAKQMTFSPASLFTGLRTSDSLTDGASYFFAELSRLQQIVRRAEKGERMLVILDEILRGTNSTDKQKGSLGLVSKLIGLPVAGIIATHDLALGTLAKAYPEKVNNFRFEAEINGDNLSFSYRIMPGIAQNTNASYLMRTMGII